MRFVRYIVSGVTGQILGVAERDVPFEKDHGGLVRVDGHACKVRDLGVVEMDPVNVVDDAGELQRHSVARQIHERFAGLQEHEALDGHAIAAAHDLVGPVAPTAIRYHAVPCTIEGLKRRMRGRGELAMPKKIQWWLALTLPPHHIDALRLPGVPVAAAKYLEAIRCRRDPHAGNRGLLLERIAQRQSNLRLPEAIFTRRLAARDIIE